MPISYEQVLAVVDLMEGFSAPWHISGGWCLDLFANEVTREHEDLEIGIRRADQWRLREFLAGWTIEKVHFKPEGNEWGPWGAEEWLVLPDFQLRVQSAESELPEFEFFLNEVEEGEWRSRRKPVVRMPEAEMGSRNAAGIPVMAPEIVLLHKAHHHRPKDEHDFEHVVGLMSARQRAWLRAGLEAQHPSDPWIPRLQD